MEVFNIHQKVCEIFMDILYPLKQIATLSLQVGLENCLSFISLCEGVGIQHNSIQLVVCHSVPLEEYFPHSCLQNEQQLDFLDVLHCRGGKLG